LNPCCRRERLVSPPQKIPLFQDIRHLPFAPESSEYIRVTLFGVHFGVHKISRKISLLTMKNREHHLVSLSNSHLKTDKLFVLTERGPEHEDPEPL